MPLALSAARPLEGELVDDLPAGIKRLRQRRDGSFTGGKPPPGRQGIRASGTERIPRINHARLTGRGLATLGAAAAAPVAVRDTQRLRQHPERRPSAGRMAAGAYFGPYHALTAGKPGKKGRSLAAFTPAIAAGAVANQFAKPKTMQAVVNAQHALHYGQPVGPHLRAAGKAQLPALATTLAAGALMTRHNASMGRYKEQTTMAKADSYTDASPGRYATGMLVGGAHGAVAGRPGRKLGAAAVEATPMLAALPLAMATRGHAAGVLASQTVKYGGRAAAVNANQRAGRLKPQKKVTASKSMTCLPTNTRHVVQRTVDGRYAGNGTTLTYVQVASRRPRNGSVPTVATPASARSGGRTSVSRVSPTRLPAAGQGSRGQRIR